MKKLQTIPTTTDNDRLVLGAAYRCWLSGEDLRRRRNRCKRFAYGDQWIDSEPADAADTDDLDERRAMRMTNNLIRQMVKTVVGRFRAHRDEAIALLPASRRAVYESNQLAELDSRALEEFLISGCCVQRVEPRRSGLCRVRTCVDNVNINSFFVNTLLDSRSSDVELVGQIHDLSVSEMLKRLSGGSRRKASWLRAVYSDGCLERVGACAAALGADSRDGRDFWHSAPGKCRLIEVWTLESREVLVCHDRRRARLFSVPYSELTRMKDYPDVSWRWDIRNVWRCRWFAPSGELLAAYDSPYCHGGHPFAIKLYPLTDGEVHSLVEDVLGQQTHVNHLLTLSNRILHSAAKGVLLYPVTALPEGFTWKDVRRIWSSCNGILPYDPRFGDREPKQIVSGGNNAGTVDMATLQMKIFDYVSGVSGILQGRAESVGNSASLHQQQVDTADLALRDIYSTFEAFLIYRDRLLGGVL